MTMLLLMTTQHTHRPCHNRAIHSGRDRSPADSHDNATVVVTCHVSSRTKITTLPGLALQAGGRRGAVDRSDPDAAPPGTLPLHGSARTRGAFLLAAADGMMTDYGYVLDSRPV
jgi:hypothetical protein